MSLEKEQTRLHIGPAGWQYDDWNGVVYPAPRPRGFDALEHIASYFNLDEINSTFYHIPPPDMTRRWAERVVHNPAFLFTVKANQAFTHRSATEADHIAFRRAIEPLVRHNRLGCILAQFPWSFRFDADARRRIDDLVARLTPLPLALEVRHGSWESADAESYLATLPAARCGIDQPVIGDSVRPYHFRPGPGGAYFRFHGRNYRNWFGENVGRDARYDYLYSAEELSPWATVIRRAAEASDRVFVVLNNHYRGQAPANALELAAMLGGAPVPAPRTLRRAFPRLAQVTTAADFDAETPGDLFDP